MSDAASMLWRLHLLGRQGLPWSAAAAYCERYFPNGGNVFAELHLAMLAAGPGDRAGLNANTGTSCGRRPKRAMPRPPSHCIGTWHLAR